MGLPCSFLLNELVYKTTPFPGARGSGHRVTEYRVTFNVRRDLSSAAQPEDRIFTRRIIAESTCKKILRTTIHANLAGPGHNVFRAA